MKIIECVPNFSEGRNPSTLALLESSVKHIPNLKLLSFEADKDYNRTVVTLAGNEESILEGAVSITDAAADSINMRNHIGEHPRLGAVDVVPFVPISDVTMQECVEISKQYGKIISERHNIPVFLYEEATDNPAHKNLSDIRKGEYEGLKDKLLLPEWQPDFGPSVFNEKLGGTVTGARFFLIAYNVNLKSTDISFAKEIAESLRESGRMKRDANGELIKVDGKSVKEPGRLKCLKGMGVKLDNYGITQVSMNLTNYNVTSIFTAFEEVKKEAERLGVEVTGSEIVGLTPLEAILAAGRFYAKGKPYTENDLLELAIESLGLSELNPFDKKNKIIDYLI